MRWFSPVRATRRPARVGPAGTFQRVIDMLLAGSAAAIVAFHGWLFWVHLTTGRILDPATAVRWAAAGLLVAALLLLRRLGVSLLWSRQAAIFWLLVALLHCGISAPAPGLELATQSDPALLFIIPSATAVALTGAAGAWLFIRRRRSARVFIVRPVLCWLVAAPEVPSIFAGFATCRAPRPPPL